MKKILIEIIAFLCALLIAAALIFTLIQNISGQFAYDTFTGNVNKVPITISSPVYGQIISLPFAEGTTVMKGQIIATIQILVPHFTPPPSNDLFHMYGNILSVQSPVNGIVGKVAFAPQSTILGNDTLMQIYTVDNTEIQILFPQGKEMSGYTAFYASNTPNGPKYPLRILGRVPTDVVSNIPPTTTVYRAKCQQVTDCQNIINNEALTIYAQRK